MESGRGAFRASPDEHDAAELALSGVIRIRSWVPLRVQLSVPLVALNCPSPQVLIELCLFAGARAPV
jgi:hypothetical protein